MRTSESTGELVKALVKAHAQIVNPPKSSENPYYSSRYASLAECIDTVKPALTANDLALIQTVEGDETALKVTTRLFHASGEWVEGETTMKPVQQTPQALGSAATYGRRYGMMAVLMLAGADDDGNAASDPAGRKVGTSPQLPTSRPSGKTHAPANDTLVARIIELQKEVQNKLMGVMGDAWLPEWNERFKNFCEQHNTKVATWMNLDTGALIAFGKDFAEFVKAIKEAA